MAAGLVIAFLAYYPGLNGAFLFDDAWNIAANTDIQITDLSASSLLDAATSGQAGPLKRPISTLSFAINYYFSGLTPFAYKLTNLAIHLINGFLVFSFCYLLLNAYAQRFHLHRNINTVCITASVVAVIWLLHPVNLSSVLYVVQRMASLASLFTLCALIAYVYGRVQLANNEPGSWTMLLAVLVFMPIAILCKEIGLLIPLYLLIIEVTVFRFQVQETSSRNAIRVFFLIFAILPACAVLVYIAANPGFIGNSYTWREFTLSERLLTEPRVIWSYIQWTLIPGNDSLGLFHDDIAVSKSLVDPATTLLALLGITGLLIAAWWLRKLAPLASFGILFFLGGHSMESSFLGLELAHEHRNYLPQLGILLPLIYYLVNFSESSRRRISVYSGITLFIIFLAGTLFIRSSTWGNVIAFSHAEVSNHPLSPRANYQMGRVHAGLAGSIRTDDQSEEHFASAKDYFIKAGKLNQSYTDGLFALLVLYTANGKAVPASIFDDLVYRLEHRPFTANSVNQMNNLTKCQRTGFCDLSNEQMENIFSAALENTSLVGRSRTIAQRTINNYRKHVN